MVKELVAIPVMGAVADHCGGYAFGMMMLAPTSKDHCGSDPNIPLHGIPVKFFFQVMICRAVEISIQPGRTNKKEFVKCLIKQLALKV